MKSLSAICQLVLFSVPAPAQTVETRTTNITIFFGSATPPVGVAFPDREVIYASSFLSTDLAAPLSSFAGFPPGSTFGQQLVDNWAGSTNVQVLLNGNFFGDPQQALLDQFELYQSDMEIATGLHFEATVSPFVYMDTVATDLFGGLLTAADADFVELLDPALATRLRAGEEIILTGTVETDFWRQDVTFQIVPEPASLVMMGMLLPLLVGARRRGRAR
jgi:hypothetical protein